MPDNYMLPYAKTLTCAELPLGASCLLAKCSFFYERPAQKYSIRLPRKGPSLSVVEIIGLDSVNQVCGKLAAVLVPFKKQPLNKTARPSGTKYWKVFSQEEVIEFNRITNDKNPIHFQKPPIVQGLLIFSQLLTLIDETHAAIRFLSPLCANEEVWILQEKDTLTGFTPERRCFHFESKARRTISE